LRSKYSKVDNLRVGDIVELLLPDNEQAYTRVYIKAIDPSNQSLVYGDNWVHGISDRWQWRYAYVHYWKKWLND